MKKEARSCLAVITATVQQEVFDHCLADKRLKFPSQFEKRFSKMSNCSFFSPKNDIIQGLHTNVSFILMQKYMGIDDIIFEIRCHWTTAQEERGTMLQNNIRD